MFTENMSMTFNVDSTIGKVVIEASKKCGGLQLFATNETHGKPLTWLLIDSYSNDIVKINLKKVF